jgi:3-oxoacyl-[acyl-carrier protein] reductase
MNDAPLLAGTTAVVTGGSRGIGRAVVRALAAEGSDVAFSYRTDAKAAREVVRAVEAIGRRAVAVASDAGAPGAAERFVDAAVAALGPVDIAVANAGVADHSGRDPIPRETWRETLETNLVGPYELVAAVRPRFRDGRGSVVLMSSISALLPYAANVPYAASKAGLLVVARSLAGVLAPNVRINAIAPGWVRTDLNAALHTNAAAHDRIVKRIPRGRWGEPDDVAAAVVFLASDGARFITGETVVVDGGGSIYWTAGAEA